MTETNKSIVKQKAGAVGWVLLGVAALVMIGGLVRLGTWAASSTPTAASTQSAGQ